MKKIIWLFLLAIAPAAFAQSAYTPGYVPASGGTMSGPLINSSYVSAPNLRVSVLQYGAKCDGSTDDATAIADALASGATIVQLPAGGRTCVSSTSQVIPAGHTLDLNGSTLSFSGTGGGACGAGTNGLVEINSASSGNYTRLTNGNVVSTNASAGCIVNISNSSAFLSNFQVDHITAIGASTSAVTVGIYTNNVGVGSIDDSILYTNLQQGLLAATAFNSVAVRNVTFGQPNTATNYEADISGCESCSVSRSTFEGGPLGIIFRAALGATVSNNWMGDAVSAPTWITVDSTSKGVNILGSQLTGYGSGTGTGVLTQNGATNIQVNGVYMSGLQDGITLGNGQAQQALNNTVVFAGTGIYLGGTKSVAVGNTLSSATASAVGLDLQAYNLSDGPNSFSLSGTGSIGVKCDSNHDFIDEDSTNVQASCYSAGNIILTPDLNKLWAYGLSAGAGGIWTQAANADSMTLGSTTGIGLGVTDPNGNYGLFGGVSGSGYGWLQAGRIDGTATAYDLHLEPSGGDVYLGPNAHSTNSGDLYFAHSIATGSPTKSCGTGAGTSPAVCSLAGNDRGGQITITTGTAPSASATVMTVTLGAACPTAAYASLQAAGPNTAALSGASDVYVDPSFSAGSWDFISGSTGLAAATSYTWNYTVTCD